MIRITTTLLFFTLLFTACAERGSTLTPKCVQQKPIQKKSITTSAKTKVLTVKVKKQTSKKIDSSTKSNSVTVQKKQTKASKPEIEEASIKEDSLFSLSDETKNRISGLLIFVIGLMIFI